MADVTLIKNVADWTDDATALIKSFNPRIFNWLGDPDGPPYRIGWVSQEGEPYVQNFVIDFPNTALKITVPDSMTVYLHKATIEIDARVTALEAGGGGDVEVAIGSWNMKDNDDISVPHGQVDRNAIKYVKAVVRNDNDDELCDFSAGKAGYICWDDDDIFLSTVNKGMFDDNDFNGTGFDRGTIYITLA